MIDCFFSYSFAFKSIFVSNCLIKLIEKMRWKVYEEETLIALVGDREGLWNPKHPDSVKKSELWDQVATVLGYKGELQR